MDEQEPFVTAERVAEFLGITRRKVLQMARAGTIPAHPISGQMRHLWVFRVSEVTQHIANRSRMSSLGSPIGRVGRKSA